jgi:hypothetical protein
MLPALGTTTTGSFIKVTADSPARDCDVAIKTIKEQGTDTDLSSWFQIDSGSEKMQIDQEVV